MNKIKKTKIVAVVGTTASGKTTIGVRLASKFSGEIVSADSRQVYKGMDIGSGKDLKEYTLKLKKNGKTKKINIPYHLIDIVSPKTEFNLAKFQKYANIAIKDISKRKKLPIVVGGTGLYTQALVDGFEIPKGEPNKKLRKELESIEIGELYNKFFGLYPEVAKKMNNSDKNNKRRLIRYIESAKAGKFRLSSNPDKTREYLILGIMWPREVLAERIEKRISDRLKYEDMLGEVERLHREGVSWNRLISFGLEYKFLSIYLKGGLGYKDMVDQLNIAERQFAKRQMSWLRRWERKGQKIHWIKTIKEAEKITKDFLI